ncbi:ABC transporter permease [Salipiger mucosus]|uniref:Autoinducer 2 import system permease protein LsrC n=1 Tax=Salipiger mucosus DSM 16094 TaxID=1123237 RepID=S9Q328_9RHOB|nr:ABC transporter permease [Salipiger mucosus]EPX75726.1 putative sugar ABC transporter permease protein [Salipiger mucosus DSM 16094]
MTEISYDFPQEAPRTNRLRRILRDYGHELLVALAILVLLLVVGAINPRFVSARNMTSVFSGNAYIAVAAIGMTMVIVTRQIDLSVGALIGVLATISGTIAVSGAPIWVAWAAPVVCGALINAVTGVLVAYAGIPSIVVSLGMMAILQGGLISVTGGAWISDLPPEFLLAKMTVLGFPMPLVWALVLTIAAAAWMKLAPFGRSLYLVGGNAEAARAVGIPVRRRIVQVFMIHGAFAGLATLLFATQLQVIQSTTPPNLELLIITASVIGGVSILGGTGTVIGSSLAAVLFAAIGSALIFVNVSAYWLRAFIGVLILLTVLADVIRRHREVAKGA